MSSRSTRSLRQGFTTGSAAAAAAKAALIALLTGHTETLADIPLPESGRLVITVDEVILDSDQAVAWVVKDGGDDPDATHGARIGCAASLVPGEEGPAVSLEGGPGVGQVTLPGLPVPVGQAAINPGPRAQITKAAQEVLAEAGYRGAVRLVLMVANGEKIAAKTLNPRLGIVGGISILGTTGIVKPFSHEAWQATIASGLAVAKAMGVDLAALTTGRKSERLLMAQRPDLPPWAFIQAADYFAFALKLAADVGFKRIMWGCFFGKLLKMAQGLEYTHAKAGASDMAMLARMAQACEASPATVAAVARANTARHALELMDPGVRPAFAARVAAKALDAARRFAGPRPDLEIVCFDFSGELLTRVSSRDQPG